MCLILMVVKSKEVLVLYPAIGGAPLEALENQQERPRNMPREASNKSIVRLPEMNDGLEAPGT